MLSLNASDVRPDSEGILYDPRCFDNRLGPVTASPRIAGPIQALNRKPKTSLRSSRRFFPSGIAETIASTVLQGGQK